MSEWKEYRLGDFLKVKHGYAFKGENIVTEETPNILVTPGNFNIGGGFKSDKFKYYKGDEFPKEYILTSGDIVVTMTDLSKDSDTLGYSAKIPYSTTHNYLHNQRIGLVQFVNENVCRDFVYWLMRTREYQNYIVGSASGTSIMHTSPSRIEDYRCLIPSSQSEQESIASVLTSIDNKIDLLHRENKTLEAMAETLFHQWFIEEAKEDWEEGKLGDFVSVIDNRGKTPPYTHNITEYPIIEVNALTGEDRYVKYNLVKKYVEKDIYDFWFRGYFHKYDIFVSTVGSIGELAMCLEEKGVIAQNVIALHANNISPFYLYQYLNYNKDDLKGLDIGSVQPSIKVPHLLNMSIIIPPHDKLKEYDIIMLDIIEKEEKNIKQIQTLIQQRDSLLPKLMSGEVKI